MKNKLIYTIICVAMVCSSTAMAQMRMGGSARMGAHSNDSIGGKTQIPVGLKEWKVDPLFGDTIHTEPDTLSFMYMNSIFTTGLRGEYNTLGNLGSPRINRIFIDRDDSRDFLFTDVYDFFVKRPSQHHFTNTLSPYTNLSYNTAGNRMNGEDHITVRFANNVGKRFGFGFNIDYLYGRGYYTDQSTSHVGYNLYGSYLGPRYQAHLILSTNRQKIAENGGITDDNYITHPEIFTDNFTQSEIPTELGSNWNRNRHDHVFFTHRYNFGFTRKVKMTPEEIAARKFAMESKQQKDIAKDSVVYTGRPDEGRITVNSKEMADSLLAASDSIKAETTEWMKDEYVPVTSFIHTMQLDNHERIYMAYKSPQNYYAHDFITPPSFTGDSIKDVTNYLSLRNTFAISLLEGFNKWVKTGAKVFLTHEFNRYTLPDENALAVNYNQNNIYLGGQLSKMQGNTFHYNATLELGTAGERAGDLKLDVTANLRFPLLGDTVSLQGSGFFHRQKPSFYLRHYHSRHAWWDKNDMGSVGHTRLQGQLSLKRTKTTLRVAVDEIENYTYLSVSSQESKSKGLSFNSQQSGSSLSIFTIQLMQDFRLGPLHLDNVITYQKSTDTNTLPVPDINIYSNLYLRFKIAQVLKCDLGADMRWFTEYYAPDYCPSLGLFAVQDGDNKTKVGNYPLVNAYANFHLKRARFFVMMSHINASSGSLNYFFTPHYPMNTRIFRFGVSWNFLN